jgi:hypothetical protein
MIIMNSDHMKTPPQTGEGYHRKERRTEGDEVSENFVVAFIFNIHHIVFDISVFCFPARRARAEHPPAGRRLLLSLSFLVFFGGSMASRAVFYLREYKLSSEFSIFHWRGENGRERGSHRLSSNQTTPLHNPHPIATLNFFSPFSFSRRRFSQYSPILDKLLMTRRRCRARGGGKCSPPRPPARGSTAPWRGSTPQTRTPIGRR